MTLKTVFAAAALAAFTAAPAFAEPDAAKPPQVTVCASCHGERGVSASPIFPNLAGQHRNYIEKALGEYKSGARKNAIMGAQAAALSAADIKALALWFSSQKPVLYTVDPEGEEAPKAAAKAVAPEKKS
ncbi:MAG: hypothetical protein NVS9B10_08880 [Nevskia sp.]